MADDIPTFDIDDVFPEPVTEERVRAAGWVPLADVLDALRDWKAFSAWYERRWGESRHGAPSMDAAVPYLAERFAPTTAPEDADERNGHGHG